jgi:cytochrome c biogenesis protein CcmG/thiol:disulfide interchange protein DsbE
MKRFIVPLAAFLLLVVVLAVGIKRAPEKGVIKSVLIGRPAPEFVVPELGTAATFDSRSMKGRWYLLNVWGTWCVECRAEHQALLAIQRSGVAPLVGLNWKDEDALATQWLAQLGNPYEKVALDRDGRVAIDFGVYGAPETFLINDAGIIVYKYVGPMSDEVWQREFVARIPRAAVAPAAPVPAS